jgi:hypothetical protein
VNSLNEQTMPYRRGRILKLLRASNDAGMSAPLLRQTLRDFGYKTDEDTHAVDVHWLSRHGLVQTRDVSGVQFVKITPRGRDITTGDLDFPGIQFIED